MNKNEYEQMSQNEERYWWHQGKKFLVQKLITKYTNLDPSAKILEVGCGTGMISEYLATIGDFTGLDMSEEALAHCSRRGLKKLIQGDLVEVQLDTKFDVILALDVLEHIQEDMQALKKIYEALKEDGVFIATVPAYKFLWSDHDEALHHKRRYSVFEITTKMRDSGFEILKKSHFVATFFFGIAIYKFFRSLLGRTVYPKTSYVALPNSINAQLANILKIETTLLDYTYLPFGTTIVIVAKKNG